MQRWEYLSLYLEADAEREMAYLMETRSWKEGVPRNTPEAMIPELNALGDQGWELVHMQPVAIGRNADVLMYENSNTRTWTNIWFCVFKRLVA